MRWYLERNKINKRRGIGAWYERGCTGTTYGEKGSNEYLFITVLFVLWEVNLNFSWKGNRYDN